MADRDQTNYDPDLTRLGGPDGRREDRPPEARSGGEGRSFGPGDGRQGVGGYRTEGDPGGADAGEAGQGWRDTANRQSGGSGDVGGGYGGQGGYGSQGGKAGYGPISQGSSYSNEGAAWGGGAGYGGGRQRGSASGEGDYGFRGQGGEGQQWGRDREPSREEPRGFGASGSYGQDDFSRTSQRSKDRQDNHGGGRAPNLSYGEGRYGQGVQDQKSYGAAGNFGRDNTERAGDQGSGFGFGGSPSSDEHPHDPHYHSWREQQLKGHDDDYRRWRDVQAKKYDEDYGKWRNERHEAFSKDFGDWRSRGDAAPSKAGEAGPEPQKGVADTTEALASDQGGGKTS